MGKTTLLHRYIDGKFLSDTKMTLGVEILTKNLNLSEENVTIMLQLWDFGGQKQFRYMLSNYALGSHAAIVMFDLTRFSTIKDIDRWIEICTKDNPDIPLILIGGKADLEDQISVEEETALKMKKKHGFIDYVKTSSKTGKNVDDAFITLGKAILKKWNE